MRLTCLALILPLLGLAQWDGNTTPTYPELIRIYQKLDAAHREIELYAMGESDTEYPIYLLVLNGAGDSLKTFQKARENTTVLVNNAIHAGEPDGVNACLLWIEEWIKKGKQLEDLPVIAIIPAYNVGGMLNRSSTSRANQDGPAEYGFRGNAQNLDLNRDFIKMDSKNMRTFAGIYQALDPDIFVDTHVSNGADYQYTLTFIHPTKEKMSVHLMSLFRQKYLPDLADNEAVICADTVVILNGKILGKPFDYEDARQMLSKLSGQKHTVITGVFIGSKTHSNSFSERTEVEFEQLSQEEITFYIEKYLPFDKAGSYGVQEWIGYVAVKRMEGTYTNVMGLPTNRLYHELKQFVALN